MRSRRRSIPSIAPEKRATRALGERPRMSRFLRFLLAVTVLVHLPVAGGIYELARRLSLPHPGAVGAAYATLLAFLFFGRARAGMTDSRRHPRVVWLVDIPYFVHWCAAVFTIVPAVLATIVFPIVQAVRGEAFALPTAFYMWTYGLGLIVCGYGVVVRRRWFRVRKVEIDVAGLDPKFDGYRIAHLSDLHIGAVTPRAWGERWTRAANASAPDMVVITGDLVTSGTEFHEDIAAVVGNLEAKDGVFVTMGNHDYFGEGEPLVTLLLRGGARVLRNEGVVLERSGAKLFLAGIDDTWTKRDDLTRALELRPDDATTILLAHDPERFRAAVKQDIELVLSGHTHGGQIAVPFLYRWLSLSHLTHHFHVGLYQKGRSKLYVHPGLGTTGPPMRLGIAPAVVILTLRAPPPP